MSNHYRVVPKEGERWVFVPNAATSDVPHDRALTVVQVDGHVVRVKLPDGRRSKALPASLFQRFAYRCERDAK